MLGSYARRRAAYPALGHGKDRIDRKRDKLDAKAAEHDAEENAVDSLDFAEWAAEQAEVAVLDAIGARAWADERAAASRTI